MLDDAYSLKRLHATWHASSTPACVTFYHDVTAITRSWLLDACDIIHMHHSCCMATIMSHTSFTIMSHTSFTCILYHHFIQDICVYIHIPMYIYTHTHVYIYTYMYIYIYIYIRIYTYKFMHICTYLLYTHININIQNLLALFCLRMCDACVMRVWCMCDACVMHVWCMCDVWCDACVMHVCMCDVTRFCTDEYWNPPPLFMTWHIHVFATWLIDMCDICVYLKACSNETDRSVPTRPRPNLWRFVHFYIEIYRYIENIDIVGNIHQDICITTCQLHLHLHKRAQHFFEHN